jgi:hypothetical protein
MTLHRFAGQSGSIFFAVTLQTEISPLERHIGAVLWLQSGADYYFGGTADEAKLYVKFS